MSSRQALLCFGSVYWDDPLITPQQVAVRLARRFDVLYVEPSPSFIYLHDARRNRRWLRVGEAPRRVADGLHVYSPPPMLPFKGRVRIVNMLSWRWIRPFVAHALRSLELLKPVFLTYLPHAHVLLGRFAESLACYYCIDDMGALGYVDPVVVRGYERRLVARADLVFTTSRTLQTRFAETHPRVHLVPNGSDPELYGRALDPDMKVAARIADLPAPVVGFTGVIDFRLDQALVAEAARRRRQWSFVFVGPVRTSVAALKDLPNVHFIESQPMSALPSFLKGFTVAVIPYTLNEMVRSIYPTKLNDYLGAGVPVITTRLPELADCSSVIVRQIDSAQQLIASVEELWNERHRPDAVARRVAFARRNSWDERASAIADCIEAMLEEKRQCEC